MELRKCIYCEWHRSGFCYWNEKNTVDVKYLECPDNKIKKQLEDKKLKET